MSKQDSNEVMLDVEEVISNAQMNDAVDQNALSSQEEHVELTEAESHWKNRSALFMLVWVFGAELLVLAGHLGVARHHRNDPLAIHYQMSCVGSLAAFGLLFFRNVATWRTWRIPLVCVIGTTVALAMITLR